MASEPMQPQDFSRGRTGNRTGCSLHARIRELLDRNRESFRIDNDHSFPERDSFKLSSRDAFDCMHFTPAVLNHYKTNRSVKSLD